MLSESSSGLIFKKGENTYIDIDVVASRCITSTMIIVPTAVICVTVHSYTLLQIESHFKKRKRVLYVHSIYVLKNKKGSHEKQGKGAYDRRKDKIWHVVETQTISIFVARTIRPKKACSMLHFGLLSKRSNWHDILLLKEYRPTQTD
jgi:hypothetical protein